MLVCQSPAAVAAGTDTPSRFEPAAVPMFAGVTTKLVADDALELPAGLKLPSATLVAGVSDAAGEPSGCFTVTVAAPALVTAHFRFEKVPA